MDELIKVAIEQGLGYALFILLLLYVLKTSGEREKKYQETIQDLTQALKGVDNVKSCLLYTSDAADDLLAV